MATKSRMQVFIDRYPLIGPAIWIATIEYFIVQLVVALRFHPGYSLRFNTISDLGNTMCGTYRDHLVCSPLHPTMNAAFIALGILMAAGARLIYQEFKKTPASAIGFSLMALAGLGSIIVGIFPENTVGALHIAGASLPLGLGNVSLVVLGLTLKVPGWLRVYTIVSGLVALLALPFLLSQHYGSLGIGGVERIVAYPQIVWLIAFGLYMSKSHWSLGGK